MTDEQANEQVINGYVFEPQSDGSLQIRLSAEAGGSEVTMLQPDLVSALRSYLGSAAGDQRAVGTPDVQIISAEQQRRNPRDATQENW